MKIIMCNILLICVCVMCNIIINSNNINNDY